MLDRLPHVCPVCAYHEWNLDGLVEMAWEYLDLIRIYTKPKVHPRPDPPCLVVPLAMCVLPAAH